LSADQARCLHLRWSPLNDHRVRLVPEAGRIFVAPALEVHPESLAAFGLSEGGSARLTSGPAEMTIAVRADWRTPPGQLYLPLDSGNEQLAAFSRAAVRPEGWPPACIHLTGIAPADRS
jgi:predicted molibdopterin-dependent oxidoreductase YjgC